MNPSSMRASRMPSPADRSAADWVRQPRIYLIAWGLPLVAILAGIVVPAPARTLLWTGAALWKGTACLLNARRCGRTHCRYTGPFYLTLALLVAGHGTGILPLGDYGWWLLGGTILSGGKLIWWISEGLLGTYR